NGGRRGARGRPTGTDRRAGVHTQRHLRVAFVDECGRGDRAAPVDARVSREGSESRMPTSATRLRSRRYKIADLTLDTGRRVVFRGDEPIALRPLTYELLRVLAEHAPDVVSNDE